MADKDDKAAASVAAFMTNAAHVLVQGDTCRIAFAEQLNDCDPCYHSAVVMSLEAGVAIAKQVLEQIGQRIQARDADKPRIVS